MSKSSKGIRWLGLTAVPVAIAAVFAFQSHTRAAGGPAPAEPAAFLTSLGMKFEGSASCSDAKCHGAATSVNKKNLWGNEYTLWHDKAEPHHSSYRTLVNPKAKAIAVALKIPSALKSERCLNCHTTFTGGDALKGQDYTPVEGVSCNSCHGPSEKYRTPHSQPDWIDGQRAKLDHEGLLKTFGLYDTLPVNARATRCTSCHLAIEPDLVAAGHPQPTFEMNYFSNIYKSRHWHDPAGTFSAELWANGQLAEIHDAMLQVTMYAASKAPTAAADLKKATDQALAHYGVFSTLISSGAVASPDAAALDADAKALAAAKDPAGASAAAMSAAGHAQAKGLVAAVAMFKDKAAAAKVLAAVAAGDVGKTYGPRGEEQQAYAIAALANAAGNDAASKAIAGILPAKPADGIKAADFATALTAVRAAAK